MKLTLDSRYELMSEGEQAISEPLFWNHADYVVRTLVAYSNEVGTAIFLAGGEDQGEVFNTDMLEFLDEYSNQLDIDSRIIEVPIICILAETSGEVPTVRPKVPDPLNCELCYELNQYAEPNMGNGSYICWSCRDSNSWKLHRYGGYIGNVKKE